MICYLIRVIALWWLFSLLLFDASLGSWNKIFSLVLVHIAYIWMYSASKKDTLMYFSFAVEYESLWILLNVFTAHRGG